MKKQLALWLCLAACGPSEEERTRADDVAELPGDAAVGAALYDEACARCHGPEGAGASARDLFDASTWPADEVVLVLLQGPRVMPSFADWSDDDLADVVAFVQEL
ncbi:MAG: c-type cytochrome [Myxococcales bacterium]|nr:c-type cytochrome [Myxococcales bacterium]